MSYGEETEKQKAMVPLLSPGNDDQTCINPAYEMDSMDEENKTNKCR